jgi:Uma2 family endonuclease
MTADELLQTPGLGRCELVRGELISLALEGFEHGRIAGRVGASLGAYVERHRLGVVMGGGTGFEIARDPDTVRAPDVAFIRAERVSAEPMMGFYPGAPDLAVEVLSPNDRADEVLAKVQDWLAAGCRAVWVIDPATRTVSVYRGRDQIVPLGISDELSGDDILPGFKVPIAEIFAR